MLIHEHHHKIAIINGRKDSSVSQERLKGYCDAMRTYDSNINDDISLIGFDRFEPFDAIEPPLTMIEQPIERIGQAAARLILKRINGEYADFPTQLKLSTKMIIRDSVKTVSSPQDAS